MAICKFLAKGLLVSALLIAGGYAQTSDPCKCDKQCRRDKSCRQGSCNHPNCRVHRRCFKLCSVKPEELKKDAVAAVADVSDREARKALKLLYDKVKDGKENLEIKKAIWKILRVMKSYHCQNEHKQGHMICPAHDGSNVKGESQSDALQQRSRRHARRHEDGGRCADPRHHHHNPEQAE